MPVQFKDRFGLIVDKEFLVHEAVVTGLDIDRVQSAFGWSPSVKVTESYLGPHAKLVWAMVNGATVVDRTIQLEP